MRLVLVVLGMSAGACTGASTTYRRETGLISAVLSWHSFPFWCGEASDTQTTDAADCFAPDLDALTRHAQAREAAWASLLNRVRRAAALSDKELRDEGRAEAVRRYGLAAAPHFWPEPPSISMLIEQSVRTGTEQALVAEIDAFVSAVSEAKPTQLE